MSGVYPAYRRWLYTQTGEKIPQSFLQRQLFEQKDEFFIMDIQELYKQRAPGNTCLSALQSGIMGTPEEPINNSKGCGGVMRVAPVGLFLCNHPEQAFRVGAEVAAITHGHPSGFLSAGFFASLIAWLVKGCTLPMH